MLRNIFSPSSSGLPLKDVIDLANRHLEDARGADTSVKALFLCGNAKVMIKDAENIINKSVKRQTFNDDIANAYHEHGKLLEELGQHSKAQKSYSKAEKWGYLHVTSRYSDPSKPTDLNTSIAGSFIPSAALSATPTIAVAVLHASLSTTPPAIQNGVSTKSKDQIPTGSAAMTPLSIFVQDVAPSVVKIDLPETGARITGTPQLAYCISLLRHSLESKEGLNGLESDWLQAIEGDPDEQRRLRSMAVDVIRAFVRDELKTSDVVSEAVSLATVLEREEFQKLLRVFVDGINQSLLLEIHLLEGLAYLMKNSPSENFDVDDLVKILELLSIRLKGTHQQSTQHTYQLAAAVSRVLDSMVDSQVKGIEREQLHEPLSQYLKELQQSSDPRLVYQAAYAYQALQYIPDDETILQTMLRRTGKVVKGISGIVSAAKALDLDKFIDGLQHIQEGFASVGEVVSIASNACITVTALVESGQSLLESLKEGLSFTRKSAWYPALRGLDTLLQEGRLIEFEKLVRGAVCRRDPAFQWGVCQRLGELAISTPWDTHTRQCAVSFLGEMYSDDVLWGCHASVKQLILQIISELTESTEGDVASHAEKILQGLRMEQDPMKCIRQDRVQGNEYIDILSVTLPMPPGSLLLDSVQNKPDVKAFLFQLRQERLQEYDPDVYISPRARVNKSATETFDLRSTVQEFLDSDKKVFLILGDSGAGKSTFNRALEIDLWHKYNKADRKIPLFIHLPAIKDLERDLVAARLRQANFTENQIRELKQHHEFILICDGYDECQQTRNLYTSNRLNQPGEWRAQMVISCRTEYTSAEYKNFFQPTDRNSRGNWEYFHEAVIAPFSKDQIQDYIDQHVTSRKSLWKTEDYRRALEQIPNLKDLVTNPFLLRLALDVLPQLLETNSEFSKARITRIKLYDEFVAQWIERGQKRLLDMDLSPRDKEAFRILSDSGFIQLSITYLKDLATEIYNHHGGNPVVEYSEYRDNKTWKKSFFGHNDGKNLLREAIPLVRNIDQYRFVHKSVLEYGLSLAVFDPSSCTRDSNQEPRSSRRGSAGSVLSFEVSTLKEDLATTIEQPLLDSPFGTRSFVDEPSILQFLGERTQQQPVFKEQLLAVIERSRTEKTARVAAANAITVLVRAGVQFNGADLRDVKIPRADLSYGVFDSARLDGADLRKTKLHNIWLRNANLSGAEMTGAQFGELPFLQEGDIVEQCEYWDDGKTLAVGLHNDCFHLYDTSSWEKIKEFRAFDDQSGFFMFSETSDRIAYNGNGLVLRLVDVKTGNCFQTLKGHTKSSNSVAYSPCRSKVASGSGDRTARVWNVETGECIHVLEGHDDIIYSLAYSPSGKEIVSASFDRTLRLWDVEAGECIHALQGHIGQVYNVAYSPNGGQIASTSADGTVRLWDVKTGSCVSNLQGHIGGVYSVAFSPDGGQIASGGHDTTIRIWDIETENCIQTVQRHSQVVYCIAYAPNGNQIASGGMDNTVRLWTVESNHFAHTPQGHNGGVISVSYSSDGARVVSGGVDKTLRLWDAETGHCVYNLHGHVDTVYGVAFSPKGDRIVSGSQDRTLRLWNVETGGCVNILDGHSNAVCSVVYSTNGDYIVSGSDDRTVRLWDAETGECIRVLEGHEGEVNYVAYSPKGDQIASSSHDRTIRLWDVETGYCRCILRGHSDVLFQIAYSPNGDQIASGSWDKTVRLWNVVDGDCTHVLQGHTENVTGVAFSPIGDLLASGSVDMTVRLWNVATGECLTVISGFNGEVFDVDWRNSLGGQYLVTGSNDKSVRHWKVVKEQDEYSAQLCWSSSHALTVTDASFKDVRGLSKVNQTLMGQRSALVDSLSTVLQ